MKNIILSLGLLVTSVCSFAQINYKGTVITASNSVLNGANIKAINQEKATTTNFSGNFEITLDDSSEVLISYMGYESQAVNLNKGINTIILQEDINSLNEIVVSGNREKQLRKDVPASISVISAKELDQIKAIGIEQVVNNVPGVYMSTSKASSNEQHFMASRSPITTKGLFLYLEDGLPIRPTAVFNHNALLEMNSISHGRVEVLKGPASSIYGSEAIGGSFNFITKEPTKEFSGSIKAEYNSLGIFSTGFEASTYLTEKTGIYVGTSYAQRRGGPFGHSDYEKTASTLKLVSQLTNKLNWINVFDAIDYRSDTSGSISEVDYIAKNYESDQTYTERDALSLRYRSTFGIDWNENNKTSFSQILRYNELGQIPSYRISQRNGTGEINNNKFRSIAGLLQHKLEIPKTNTSIIGGLSIDYSPQDYVANVTDIEFDAETSINTGFTVDSDNFIANYQANILNYAAYLQIDTKINSYLSLTGAIRFDEFEYDFDNKIEDEIIVDSVDKYQNIAPKLGFNLNISNNIGFYGNYSTGFTPPQASTLYRSGDDINVDLKPSEYDNFEIGTYMTPFNGLKVDLAAYFLEGVNTLISFENEAEVTFNTNAGKTRSFGIEYGLSYQLIKDLTISHNGSFANHRYIDYQEGNVDYSNTDRETAPKLTGTSKLIYNSSFIKGLTASISHELVGKYNTSLENQAVDANNNPITSTYSGHNVFDLLISYKVKKYEIWANLLNAFDKQHANYASFSTFRNANTYTVGNSRAIHGGIKYNF